MSEDKNDHGASRRTFIQLGAAGAAAVAVGATSSVIVPELRDQGLMSKDGVFDAASIAMADSLYKEVFPTSPLIMEPFKDELPIPKALAPVPRTEFSSWSSTPGPGVGQQNSLGNEKHQKWCTSVPGLPDPLVYIIKLQVAQHAFTTSPVMPINSLGQPTQSFDELGNPVAAGTVRSLPLSTIYGFNGTFPGPMINAEYGKPCLVRFVNNLDENPLNLDRQDFGAPDLSFLTHLHNAHTAPESDGNPHYSMNYGPLNHGYQPGMWCDNLYLNWPAGNDDREKQSFFWFHDHRMDHTGANVYKGMVGLYPIYDPKPNNSALYGGNNGMRDGGDENQGLRLPGVRTNNPDGSFDVAYDIPLALYDCRLDDGVTRAPGHARRTRRVPRRQQPADAPRMVGQDVLQALPQPRLRRRHLHRQRHGLPHPHGEAPQVPLPVPRCVHRPLLRVQADELHAGPEVGSVARLHRQRTAGSVPHPRRPAVHEVHPDRGRRRHHPVRDHPRLVRAVARQAPRVHRRLHQVPGRHAHHEGRRHLPDQRDEDARRPHVEQLARGSRPTRRTRCR